MGLIREFMKAAANGVSATDFCRVTNFDEIARQSAPRRTAAVPAVVVTVLVTLTVGLVLLEMADQCRSLAPEEGVGVLVAIGMKKQFLSNRCAQLVLLMPLLSSLCGLPQFPSGCLWCIHQGQARQEVQRLFCLN